MDRPCYCSHHEIYEAVILIYLENYLPLHLQKKKCAPLQDLEIIVKKISALPVEQ